MNTYQDAFNARTELKDKFGPNALLLYALELRYEIEDIISVASESLTDGGNDKKCDLIYIERDAGFAVIAQAYMKLNPSEKDSAPSNKASDLNTAAAWIFTRDLEDIPEQIKDSVKVLQEAISTGEINTVYFWYVHNFNESNNIMVQNELDTVQLAAKRLVDAFYPDVDIRVFTQEIGNQTIEKWYKNSSKQIVIEDEIIVKNVYKGFEIAAPKWRAYVTAVSGNWLREIYSKYKDELFSGNPRDFLGAGKRKNKINLGIKNTVQQEPQNFWAYNNGLTALVNNYEYDEKTLTIKGITIINGAQTTGAIGTVESSDITQDFYVPIRFIICNDNNVIDEIINNNNKQNVIISSDLRSNDKQQDRLRKEFKKHTNYYYSGGRRSDVRPRNKQVLDPSVVAQALLAFHRDPVFAYNSKQGIWEEDKMYNFVFPDQLSAEHIIFVYSLSRAIDEYKTDLKNSKEALTTVEDKQLLFLSKRGAKMLLIYAIAHCFESLISKKISNVWTLHFNDNTNFDEIIKKWKLVIKSVLPFYARLLPALESGLNNKEIVETVSDDLASLVTAIQDTLRTQLKSYIDAISV